MNAAEWGLTHCEKDLIWDDEILEDSIASTFCFGCHHSFPVGTQVLFTDFS